MPLKKFTRSDFRDSARKLFKIEWPCFLKLSHFFDPVLQVAAMIIQKFPPVNTLQKNFIVGFRFFSCYNLNFVLSASAREIEIYINHNTAAKIFLDDKLKTKNPAHVSGEIFMSNEILIGVALGGEVFVHRLSDDFGVLDGEHDIFRAYNNVTA